MEKDDELRGQGLSYNTEFRQYDALLGRWLSVDPMASMFPGRSPYVAFGNNPILFVDPRGDEEEDRTAYRTPSGKGITLPNSATDLTSNEHGDLTGFTLDGNKYSAKYSKTENGKKKFDGYQAEVPVWYFGTYTKTYEDRYSMGKEFQTDFQTVYTMAIGVAEEGTIIKIASKIAQTSARVSAVLRALSAATGTITLIGSTAFLLSGDTRIKGNTGAGTVTAPVPVPPPLPFWYVTYTKKDMATGKIYVGRSSGYALTPQEVVNRRDYGHHMNKKGLFTNAVLSTSLMATVPGGFQTRIYDASYWAIRASEDTQIRYYKKLGISANGHNGISDVNKLREQYYDAFRNMFGN